MIRPIFSEPETLLDRCVFSQNQHTFIPAQLRIRRDAHIELSVFFQRKNVDVILFSDIDVCIVTIGGNFQSSLETTSLLKELGAKLVVSRAERDLQAKFLLRNGADEVVYPEKQLAKWADIHDA